MEKKRMDYFPVWLRYRSKFKNAKLTREQYGDLFIAMLDYQDEGLEPENLDQTCTIFWGFLIEDLKRAQLKYQQAVEKGQKGGRPSKKLEKAEESQEKPEKGRTTTTSTSTTTSTTESTSTSISTPTGSAPANAAGVCDETQSFGEFGWVKLTDRQYKQLLAQLGPEELHRCITYVDEAAQSTGNRNHWKDWYLMIRRCHDSRWYETRHYSTRQEIPKGASGILGEAELEAIQRVLRDGA